MKEIDTKDLVKAKKAKLESLNKKDTKDEVKTAEKAAKKVGKALQKKYAMLKKHTESDKVKHQINQLNEALQNKATELQKLEQLETAAAASTAVPKIKLQ